MGEHALFLMVTIVTTILIRATLSINLNAVSWNINGVEKLHPYQHERDFLASFDVVLLQETFSLTTDATHDIPGFIPHHQLGRYTTRRPQWGVSTLWRIDAIVGGTLLRIPCPFEWIVVSRWRLPTDIGLLVVNVYLPIHSEGFTRFEADNALSFIASLRSDFPADRFLLGGDLNVDPWKLQEKRASGIPISTRSRSVLNQLEGFFDPKMDAMYRVFTFQILFSHFFFSYFDLWALVNDLQTLRFLGFLH
jgi:exonuclease III